MIALLLSFIFSISARAEVVWQPRPAYAFLLNETYPAAQRLLLGFDYGHALLYERLLLNRGKISDPEAFEKKLLAEILVVLKDPPHIKSDEEDLSPFYARTFALPAAIFDWSHLLHQYLWDSQVEARFDFARMKELGDARYAEYVAQKRLRVTDLCKTMLYMDGHAFSKAFRRTYPALNQLVWMYHWFQIKIHESLMESTPAARDQAVSKTISRFWELIADLPDSADMDMMPDFKGVAPKFYAVFPRVAEVLNNMHMLHDIVSDMLVSPKVPTEALGSEAIRYARMAMDPAAYKSNHCVNQIPGDL